MAAHIQFRSRLLLKGNRKQARKGLVSPLTQTPIRTLLLLLQQLHTGMEETLENRLQQMQELRVDRLEGGTPPPPPPPLATPTVL